MADPAEPRALLTVALLAAAADGMNEGERAVIRRLADGLGEAGMDLAALEADAAAGRIRLADAVRPLSSIESRKLAYETAVGVTAADGAHSAAEQAFLADLAGALGLPAAAIAGFNQQAGAIAAAPVAASVAAVGAAGAAAAAAVAPAGGGGAMPATGVVMPDPAAIDQRILDASITNAALEILPETLASMAIIPLQMRLVYRIGQAYGYELDQGHIKDFIATLGVGMAGQYVEQFGRKLLGGLLGSVLGGFGRSIGNQAASSGMSFATTWAIGQVAKQYYAGGRTLDADKLRAAFAPLYQQATALGGQYAGAIRERAQNLDLKSLPSLISKG